MDIYLIFQSVMLGILEGLTEFIPVSSTGHLILTIDLIGFQGPPGKIFEIVIQLGAICAICWAYKDKLLNVAGSLNEKKSQRFVGNLLVAFLPAAIIGIFLHGFIKEVLFSPLVVSVMLIIGGVIIIIIERMNITPRTKSVDEFSYKLAFKIGCCQVLAMIPGVSRSGATIMGALALGTERKAATEFSFFLAIPTMFGATVYDLYKNYDVLNMDNISVLAVGFISAFIAALMVIKTVIAFISTHGFTPFGWYRIALGAVMLGLLAGNS